MVDGVNSSLKVLFQSSVYGLWELRDASPALKVLVSKRESSEIALNTEPFAVANGCPHSTTFYTKCFRFRGNSKYRIVLT